MMEVFVKWLPKITLAAVLVMAAHTLVLFYWTFWPYTVLEVKSFQVLEQTVASGNRIVYRMEYCKNPDFADLAASVQYSFSGELNYGLFGQTMSFIPSGCGTIVEVVPVPPIPAGKYRLEMTRTYHVNLVRDVVTRAYSKPFEITEQLLTRKVQ